LANESKGNKIVPEGDVHFHNPPALSTSKEGKGKERGDQLANTLTIFAHQVIMKAIKILVF
jgi:hypothetical protein